MHTRSRKKRPRADALDAQDAQRSSHRQRTTHSSARASEATVAARKQNGEERRASIQRLLHRHGVRIREDLVDEGVTETMELRRLKLGPLQERCKVCFLSMGASLCDSSSRGPN
eukprot:SAG11_NODE_1493_length_4805_cov_14.583510_6_plen_114_part_00